MHLHPLLATLLALAPTLTLAAPAPAPAPVHSLLAPLRAADILPRDAATDASYTDNARFQSDMLAHHNNLRGEHKAPALAWDTELARVAAQLTDACVYEHSHGARSGGPYGENIALGYPSVPATCTAWGEAERREYTPAEYENPTYNPRMGHFTQVVWAGTRSVGCARTLCDARWFVACEYSPRGNVRGAENYRENVKSPVAGAAAR